MLLAAPASAQAQSPAPAPAPGAAAKSPESAEKNIAEAKSRYKAGLALYDDGAFDAARVQFERAYDLAPSYKILYNIGLVYKQLNEFVGSLKALEKYLAEGGAEVPEERKVEVNKMIDLLKPIIGSATVGVNVAGAEIMVDDVIVGKSPFSEPILLNPGKRKISGKLEGWLPDAKVVTVASGDKVEVALKLIEPPKQKVTDFKPVIFWSATGILAVSAGIMGFLTLKASGDLDDMKKTRNQDSTPTTPEGTLGQQLHDQQVKMSTFGLVTDVCTALAIVSGGFATYFTFFNKSKDSDKPTNTAPAPATAVRFTPTLGGGAVVGTF